MNFSRRGSGENGKKQERTKFHTGGFPQSFEHLPPTMKLQEKEQRNTGSQPGVLRALRDGNLGNIPGLSERGGNLQYTEGAKGKRLRGRDDYQHPLL